MTDPLYMPLPFEECIRTLSISPGEESSIIEATFQVMNLQETPAYSCLSYTWDGPRHEDTDDSWKADDGGVMLLNGAQVPIRRNLRNALRSLRAHEMLEPIWIDAVCIDQANIAERSSQVAQMGAIYKIARDVIVWLGGSQPEFISAIRNMRRLNVELKGFVADMVMDVGSMRSTEEMLASITACGLSDQELVGIVDFMVGIRWFSRVWTIQEMVLAKELNFLLGDTTASLEDIWKGSFLLLAAGLCSTWSRVQGTKTLGWARAFMIQVATEHVARQTGDTISSVGIVANTFREREASNDKDKIYGVLGISRTKSDWVKHDLKVDYSLETHSVYTQAAVHGIAAWRGLEPLCYVGDQTMNKIKNLPSWVPDYTQEIPWKTFQQGDQKFRASASAETVFWYDPAMSEEVILFHEMQFDTISAVCPAHWTSIDEGHLFDLLQIILGNEAKSWPYEASPLRVVILNVLLAGGFKNNGHAPEENLMPQLENWLFCQLCVSLRWTELGEYNHILKDITQSLRELKEKFKLSDRFMELTEIMLAAQQRHQSWNDVKLGYHGRVLSEAAAGYVETVRSKFVTQWEFAGRNRCIFRTEKGYLGLGPRMVREGDRISILQGANVPYVFRHMPKDPDTVVDFVGEAYLHGVMFGEALELSSTEFRKISVY